MSGWRLWVNGLRFYAEVLPGAFVVFPILFVPVLGDCLVSEMVRQTRNAGGELDIRTAVNLSLRRAPGTLSVKMRFIVSGILWSFLPVFGWMKDLEHRVDLALVSNVVAFESLEGGICAERCVELRKTLDWKRALQILLVIPTILSVALLAGLTLSLTYAPGAADFWIFVFLVALIAWPMSSAVNTLFYLSITDFVPRFPDPGEADAADLRFEDYCPLCTNFDDAAGICKAVSVNIRAYPKKFKTECRGKYYSPRGS